MKKAKSLVLVGSILRLIGGIALIAMAIIGFISSKAKGGTISKEELVPVIGFAIFGIVSLITSIINLTLAKRLDDRTLSLS